MNEPPWNNVTPRYRGPQVDNCVSRNYPRREDRRGEEETDLRFSSFTRIVYESLTAGRITNIDRFGTAGTADPEGVLRTLVDRIRHP
jgi:hypothetical protein